MKLITMVKLVVPFILVAGIIAFALLFVAKAEDRLEEEENLGHGKRDVSGTHIDVPELEGSASEVVTLIVAPPPEVVRRMGVVGPLSTPNPPRFHESENANSISPGIPLPSASSVGDVGQRQEGRLLPLSPHSPHNVFSVHEGIGVLAEERQFFEDLNDLHISSAWDLNLKLRALEKAQEDIGFPVQKVLANATVQCEAFITTGEFYIRSPNYPYNYPPNLTCDYNIYRREGSCGVELTVLRFDLASPDPVTGYCRDNLRVMGRPFCGRRQRGETALLTFPGLLLPLKLETGPGHGASGLLLQGRQVKDCRETRQLGRPIAPIPRQCVSSLQGEKFTLRSPGYPESYPHNSECWYFIQRRSANHCGVKLKVEAFSVEAASCMFDYVEVGQERICGSKASGTKYYFPFEDSKLSIRFRSDESITRPGFVMEGEQVKCSDVTSQEEDEYHDPKTLQDFISATADRINFVSSAATVNNVNAKPQDLFDVNNNDDDDINYILSLVGRAPLPLEGERPSRQDLARQLNPEEGDETTTLASDDQQGAASEAEGSGDGAVTTEGTPIEAAETDDGPVIDPTAAPTSDTTEIPEEEVTTISGINGVPTPTLSIIGTEDDLLGGLGPCDEVYEEESFTLRSPKITEPLPKRVDCSYFVKRSSDDICEIRILLMTVSLKPKPSSGVCTEEYLQIAGTRFCGGDSDEIVRIQQPSSVLRLTLHADAAQEDTGFAARIEQIRGSACFSDQPIIHPSLKCDTVLTRETSTITSPLYPGPYPENSNCHITVRKIDPFVQSVTLFLEQFNVEESPDCQKDYLSVGGARLCGRGSGETIHYRFPANELLLEFRSDNLQAASGYKIHVRQNRFPHAGAKPFGSTTRPPKPGYTGSKYPSSTLRPPPSLGRPLPLAPGGSYQSTFIPNNIIVGGPDSSVTLRPPTEPEVATDLPTITECGGTIKRKEVIIKSPDFPASPPKDLHCVYKIEKISSDVCQLKIEIHALQLGGRIECGRSFLQVGSQQRLCGAQRGSDIRTYHFTEDVMELIFHTGPDELEGGFFITVQQMPCGYFEPIGTYSKLQTSSGVQVVTGPSISSISTQVTTAPTVHTIPPVLPPTKPTQASHFGDYIGTSQHFNGVPPPTKPSLASHFGASIDTSQHFNEVSPPTKPSLASHFGASIDTSQHFNGHNYHSFPTTPVTILPTTTTHYPNEYNLITPQPPQHTIPQHFIYYYIPGEQYKRPRPQQQLRPQHKRPQKQQQAKPGKGYNFMHNMKNKYEKMKKMFYKNGYKSHGSVEVEGEVKYVRPRPRKPTVAYSVRPRSPRRPTIPRQVHFSQGRPQRYQFVRNPYYRPREVEAKKKPEPTVRFRYPQVYSPPIRHTVTTNRPPRFRQKQNAFLVIPTGPAQQGVPPGDFNVVAQLHPQQIVTPRPTLYTAPPRPVYVTTPRPVFLATRRPPIALTQRPVIRVSTPRPIVSVTTPRPYITSTRVPTSSSTIYFPPTPTPAVVRLQNAPYVQGSRPVVGYNAFFVAGRPGYRGKQLHDSFEEDQLLSSASVVSPVTANDCGQVIRDNEFFIRSPELVPLHSVINDPYCTYTIAKSGPNHCLLLEVEDFKHVGRCVEDNSLRCDPAAHMLTRFSPDGDLMLQFNRSMDGNNGGAIFTVHGRQQLCTDTLTVTSADPPPAVGEGRSPKPHSIILEDPVSTALPRVVVGQTSTAPPVRTTAAPLVFGTTATPAVVGTGDGWKMINPMQWVGSGGRGRQSRKIIEQGGRIVNKLRRSEDGLGGGN